MVVRFAPELAVVYLLAFARVGAIVMLLPGFGETTVPVRIRLVFALFLTLVLHPVVAKL